MTHILPVIQFIGGDKSWRVRWALASRLHEFCPTMGEDVSNGTLSVIFESLLNDVEPEVCCVMI